MRARKEVSQTVEVKLDPPNRGEGKSFLVFSFEQKWKGRERGLCVSSGWERTEAISKREKEEDSDSDVRMTAVRT
ncbi:hypothetical protein TNCV_305371 [Trichonephila clavipes]|nr:hypothetical protein TNCV_2611291 [Trichonephila clavipes]GFU64598.1 hypothetical protein TNCV_305371 [Trichonephila clavipes]